MSRSRSRCQLKVQCKYESSQASSPSRTRTRALDVTLRSVLCGATVYGNLPHLHTHTHRTTSHTCALLSTAHRTLLLVFRACAHCVVRSGTEGGLARTGPYAKFAAEFVCLIRASIKYYKPAYRESNQIKLYAPATRRQRRRLLQPGLRVFATEFRVHMCECSASSVTVSVSLSVAVCVCLCSYIYANTSFKCKSVGPFARSAHVHYYTCMGGQQHTVDHRSSAGRHHQERSARRTN